MKTAALIVATTLLATTGCSGDATGSSADALSASDKADQATVALMHDFYDPSERYLGESYPLDHKPAGYWIYAQAFDAFLDGVQRTGQYREQLSTIYEWQELRGWTSDFFDDESWMSLALIRAFDITHDARYLHRAEALFADIWNNGWTGAGVWWNRQHVEQATASNFGPAIVAARLAERTHRAAYKGQAEHIYNQWYSTMVDHAIGRVADHRNPDGSVKWTDYTYNTGLAIGASIELWRITSNDGYRSHAYAFASYLIHNQVQSSVYGDVLHDDNCTGDCDAFKGIAFRYLAKLYELDTTQTQYRNVLVASANAIWGAARDPGECIFSSDWTGPDHSHTSLAADASAVMALNIAAEDGL